MIKIVGSFRVSAISDKIDRAVSTGCIDHLRFNRGQVVKQDDGSVIVSGRAARDVAEISKKFRCHFTPA